MERLRFLAITGSNLDEFFMVRVAGVKAQVNSKYKQKGNDFDLTPQELLPLLEEKTHRFMERQYSCLHRSILPALEKQGIRFLSVEEMDGRQKEYLSQYFQRVLFPVLTPLAVDSSRPFPLLANKSLNIAVCLKSKEHNKEEKVFAIVQVPSILPRFLELPANAGVRQFTLLEEVIILHEGKILLVEETQELLERVRYVSGKAEEVDAAVAGLETHHPETLGRSKGVTVFLKPGQKMDESRDVSVQMVNLQKAFVALCGEEAHHEA